MGILNMARKRSDPPTTIHATKNRRGRNDNDTLPIRIRYLSCTLHSQLVLPVFHARVYGSDCLVCWDITDDFVFRFLLYLLYKVSFLPKCVREGCANIEELIGFCKARNSTFPFKFIDITSTSTNIRSLERARTGGRV